MKYGDLPIDLGKVELECKEMMFYQYLPIKMRGEIYPQYEDRLEFLNSFMIDIFNDFIRLFDRKEYIDSYVYLTIKHQHQSPGSSFNREGYHSDGFMTKDINYIWSDKFPTVFNSTEFSLSADDLLSMKEMENQAIKENEVTFPNSHLLRLNEFNIHKVGEVTEPGFRTFIKLSFSKDKYDLIGNSHNYEVKYDWEMKSRKEVRNIPQSKIS